jgi:hypothetical protein
MRRVPEGRHIPAQAVPFQDRVLTQTLSPRLSYSLPNFSALPYASRDLVYSVVGFFPTNASVFW